MISSANLHGKMLIFNIHYLFFRINSVVNVGYIPQLNWLLFLV